MILVSTIIKSLGAQEPERNPRLGLSPLLADSALQSAAYSMPTMCVAAAQRIEQRARRTIAAQEAMMIPRADTFSLAPATVQTAAQCGQRFLHAPVTATDTFELPGLLRLALLANADARVPSILSQWRLLAHDSTDQGEVLLQGLRLTLEFRPRTAERVRSAGLDLDAIRHLGYAAIEPHIVGQSWIAGLTHQIASPEEALLSADSVIGLWESLRSRGDYERFVLALDLGVVCQKNSFFATSVGQVNSPEAHQIYNQGAKRIRSDLLRLAPLDGLDPDKIEFGEVWSKWMWTLDKYLGDVSRSNLSPLHAQHWFHRSDTTGTLPVPSTPTVIVWVNANCGEACYPEYAAYRRLYATLAPKGIPFILMTRTSGYFHQSTMLPPAQEVDSIRTYFLDRLQLPGTLGVEETPFRSLPDGRRLPVASSNVRLSTRPGDIGLVTKSGLFMSSAKLNGYDAVLGTIRGDNMLAKWILLQMDQ